MRAAILVLFALAACRDPGATGPVKGAEDPPAADPYDVEVGPYEADIRWTAWGIPHISAEDWGSVAYGLGYAFAGDHGCVLADQIVMVRSERTQFFGAGPDDLYLHQDIGWKSLGVYAQAEAGWFELSPNLQQALVGYAAGYNRWVAEGDAPDACAGAPWLRDASHIDLLAYYIAFGLNGSGGLFVDAVGSAAPPNAPGGPIAPADHVLDALHQRAVEPELGSNGWAIGRDRTAAGDGMLLSNTHFPAEGERQWHESHLTIPGELDVYGASLMGVPIINIGFNAHVAWTHTVSMTPRFIAALLTLDPEDPTRYLYDGEYLDMVQTDYTVQVLQDDGSLQDVTRATYRSVWGPVINAPVLGWNELFAVTYQDANDNNVAMADIWVAMNLAENLEDFEAAHRDINAVPWVHTLAVDDQGTAWYADSASTPNWSAEAVAAYPDWLDSQPLAALFDKNGARCVDGSDPVFHWVEAPGARAPGLVPFDDAPQMERTDFVYNANDNHWMTNPAAPMTGYPFLYGDVDTPRSPRTRMNAAYLMETGPGSASGEDGLFTLGELEAAALSGRGIFAELMLPDIVARCEGITTIETDAGSVDISPACAALAGWDGTVTTDARGAHVWREMLASDAISRDDLMDGDGFFEAPFDPSDPIGTPHTLGAAPDDSADPVLLALADATRVLAEAGLPLDARLGDVQFMRKGEDDIGVGGGQAVEGTIAIANYVAGDATLLPGIPRGSVVNSETGLTVDGYQVNYGNSWVLAVEMTSDGPEARAVMTYSQSQDPRSPHFSDQTTLYSQGILRPVLFHEEDISGNVESAMTLSLP